MNIHFERTGRVGKLDPLIQTGRGSYVFYSETTLNKVLESFDRAFPEYTDTSREEVIEGWLAAERWLAKNELTEMVQ